MLKKVQNIVDKSFDSNSVSLQEISKLKLQTHIELKKDYPEVEINIIDEMFNRLFTTTFNINDKVKFKNGSNSFREFEEKYPNFEVPDEYKELDDHFNRLKNLPQPAQRSKEWYDYRYNRITASDTAAAIDLNPYEPVESFILKKCDPNFPFRDNDTVFHGKKYEPIATLIYEHIYNTRVFEFGALPSDTLPFLGASPDGICSKYTLDNKFSERLGTMLEIKCPVTREICTKGKIAGDHCPFYYYCQVQQQLACCDLTYCDFWQCKLSEYKSRDEYLADNRSSSVHTEDIDGDKIEIDDKLKKGLFLEFYPKSFTPEFEGAKIEWKGTYIMPRRLDMNETEYDKWVIKMMDQYKELYPDIAKDYYFHRIIYWKLEKSHNVTIERDDKFFNSILPIMKETWNRILYYREHQDKLDELKEIVEARKKYLKMDVTYKIHNDVIIEKNIDFLSKDFDISTILSNKTTKKSTYTKKVVEKKDIESDDCDFIDDEPKLEPKKETKKEAKIEIIKSKSTKKDKEIDELNAKNAIKKEKRKQLTLKTVVKDADSNSDCDFID